MEGQQWQTLENDEWATLATLRQLWMENIVGSRATIDGQQWQTLENDGWATMAKLSNYGWKTLAAVGQRREQRNSE